MSGKDKVYLDKRERKLPGLLVEGNCTRGEKWAELVRTRCRLRKLREKDPEKYAQLRNQYFASLEAIKAAIDKRDN